MKIGALLLGFSFFLSKILGLIRDHLLAGQFGAGNGAEISAAFNLDTYYAAFRIPDFLFNQLSYGVLAAAFIPIFVEIFKKESIKTAFKFASDVLRLVTLIIAGFSIIIFILAPYILPIFVPGFSKEALDVTVAATRIMLVTPLFFTIGSIAGGIQNAMNRFFALSLAPLFYNLGIIGGIVFLSKTYGVYGVAIGVAVGSFVNMLVQLPTIIKMGFKYAPSLKWWNNRVKEMILLSLPRILGMSVTQVSLIIDTIIASTLAAGSITVINFAANLESLPIGIIGVSVAVVSFGTLSAHAADQNMHEFTKEITTNLRRILFLLIPLAFGMFSLRFQIVQIVLEKGAFTNTDTVLTANTLGFFLIGLMFGGIMFLLARGFYALKNTKTPVKAGIAAVAINIIASILLTKVWKFETYGLAVANSTADIFNAAVLLILLSKRLSANIINLKEIGKFFAAAILMLIAVHFTKNYFGNVFVQTAVSVVFGALVYFGACFAMRCEELKVRIKSL
ncbi:murein biosynthesis integral membrane protein MurJ [Candidatus Peregrinibacteria bacterium]|nr:murein biosynthesis integral membrane protein MurJ [Candidatus Peregrinibacteria bacterium]